MRTGTQLRQDEEMKQANQERQKEQKEALKQTQEYYADYLAIATEYAQKIQDIEVQRIRGEITEQQANILKEGAKSTRDESLEEKGYTTEELEQHMQGFQDVANALVTDNIDYLISEYETLQSRMELAKASNKRKRNSETASSD
jgi:hypothetical protein